MTTLALPPPPWLQNDEIRQTKLLKDKFRLEAHETKAQEIWEKFRNVPDPPWEKNTWGSLKFVSNDVPLEGSVTSGEHHDPCAENCDGERTWGQSFWEEFNDSLTLGGRERVPALRHDFQSNEWSAGGRFLTKDY